ncbi:hypothetical protein BDR06DRAFT_967253 [Suillus hirtellus]|nr:hypothetical protein BDR06DRAFT_967253 [Suillus hirtellus]
MIPRYSKENFLNILKLADDLKRVALVWLLAQGEDVIPIPGTKKVKVSSHIASGIHGFDSQYFEENLGAINVMLSAESVQEVRVIAEKADWVVGDRYPPAAMKALYAETPLPKSPRAALEFEPHGLIFNDYNCTLLNHKFVRIRTSFVTFMTPLRSAFGRCLQ